MILRVVQGPGDGVSRRSVAHPVRIADLIAVGKNDVWPGGTSDHLQ